MKNLFGHNPKPIHTSGSIVLEFILGCYSLCTHSIPQYY